MTYENFKGLVRNMRGLQTEYFKTRDPQVLSHAKEAERAVDRVLESDGQRSLFEQANPHLDHSQMPF